jgi:type IV secretory pathway VirJ component
VPGRNGTTLQPAPQLETPWVALQAEGDPVCGKEATVRYASPMRSAEVVGLPGVGHWEPQLRQAFSRLVRDQGTPPVAGGGKLTGLPIVEVPAHGQGGDTLAVVLSGDGGWAGLDREVAGGLAERGIPVVGFNSLQYFWTARTPDGTARDVERILRHYLAEWHRDKAILIGYSFGAEVLPFAVSRLPADLQERIRLVTLLAPGRKATFEFHVGDWLGLGDSGLLILPEVKKLAGKPLLCLYGKDEDPKESLCPEISPPLGRSMALEGGHHFGGGYQALASLILGDAPAGAGR